MSPISSGAGWIVLALLLVSAAFAIAVALVRRAARMPLAFACAVGLAVLVCAETVAMNALSLLAGVTRTSVALAHVFLIALGAGALLAGPSRGASPRHPAHSIRRARATALLVLPLAALAAASAVRYAPNTGDSMTYHLARVAHWIQQASVEVYPTGTLRQTVMMPGAEYVLLALQVVSGSDRLAALLQLGAYLILVFAAPTVARIAGAPARHARWAAPLTAALPMAVLQASSTQNDLVAAVMVVAVIASALCLRRAERSGASAAARVTLVGACCAAALAVKASALLVSIPILLLLAIRVLGRGRRSRASTWAVALVPGALVAALVLSPELVRRNTVDRIETVVPVYPALAEWGDRAANVVRGVLHHLPYPPGTPGALAPRLTTRSGSLAGDLPQLVPHEDVVGNPLHAAAVLVAGVVFALRSRRITRRGRWAIASALGAWVLFHVTLRDNEYVTRLQMPLFAVAPAFMAVLPRPRARDLGAAALAAGAIGAVSLAVAVGASNELRPPLAARAAPIALDYYRSNPLVREAQTTALRLARASGCRRLGLFMGESGFEYPLTWQALQEGIEVRHVFGSAEWPCLVYAEPSSFGFWNIRREPVALGSAEWMPAASNQGGVFLYRRIAPASRAGDRGRAASPR